MRTSAVTFHSATFSTEEWESLMEAAGEDAFIAFTVLSLTDIWDAPAEFEYKIETDQRVTLTYKIDHGEEEEAL